MRSLQLIGFLFVVSFITVSGQDGKIDPTFAVNGTFRLQNELTDNYASSISLFSDSSILVARYLKSSNPVFLKLQKNGSLDTSFGVNGALSIHGKSVSNCVAAVQYGKQCVTAYSDTGGITVQRWDDFGNPDTSFGTNGSWLIKRSGTGVDKVTILKIDQQNRIILCIISTSDNRIYSTLFRLTHDGIPDQRFGNKGKFLVQYPAMEVPMYGIDTDSHGNIVLTGSAKSGIYHNFLTYKLLQSGQLDPAFGNNGIAYYQHQAISYARCVKFQSDGKILVGGLSHIQNPFQDRFTIIRYHPNGTLDSSFGTGGIVYTQFTEDVDVINELLIQPDGRIIAAGVAGSYHGGWNGYSDCALARYLPNGTLDSTFGKAGKTTYQLTSESNSITSALLQGDNRVLAAGFANLNGKAQFFVSAYSINKPVVIITSIDTGNTYDIGTFQAIKWVHQGISAIKLEISTSSGQSWMQIPGAENIPAINQYFIWKIPNTPSTKCLIRITDLDVPSNYSISPVFTINPLKIHGVINAPDLLYDTDFDGKENCTVTGINSHMTGDTIISYNWFVDGSFVINGMTSSFPLKTGTHEIRLDLKSSLGAQGSVSVFVDVISKKLNFSRGINTPVSQLSQSYFLSSADKNVYQLDSSFIIKNTYASTDTAQSPIVISSRNLLYFITDEKWIRCLDSNLSVQWEQYDSLGGHITPVISSDGLKLYYTSKAGIVTSRNALNGEIRWRYNTNRRIMASPLLLEQSDGSKVLITGTIKYSLQSAALIAIKDLGDRADTLWQRPASDSVLSAPAFYANGNNSMIFHTSTDGHLYRTRWDGYYEPLWKVDLKSRVGSCSPLIDAEGAVYVGTLGGKIIAHLPSFISTWYPRQSFSINVPIEITPAISSAGNMYVGTRDGTIHAIDIKANNIYSCWHYRFGKPLKTPLFVNDSGIIIVGAASGDLLFLLDPHIFNNYNYHAIWPTFLGNNRRSRVASMITTAAQEDEALPASFALHQNYPNPFNPTTVIEYAIPTQTHVELKVFDILGETVAQLVNSVQPAGIHSAIFEASRFPSGVYFYQIKTGENTAVRKMLLLK